MNEADGTVTLDSSPEIDAKVETSIEAFLEEQSNLIDEWDRDILTGKDTHWAGATALDRFLGVCGLDERDETVNEDGTITRTSYVQEKWDSELGEAVLQHLASIGMRVYATFQSGEDGSSWLNSAEPYGELLVESMSAIGDSELETLREKAAAFDRIAEPFASDGFSISDLGHHVFHLVSNYSDGSQS